MGSTRWCPTAEQVMILEEMYRRGGVRTPSATQIQHITSHLSVYGKIEGKNVFYWFQNHKARDRQKLRRKLMMLFHQNKHLFYTNHHFHLLHSPPAAAPYNYNNNNNNTNNNPLLLHPHIPHNSSFLLLGGVENAHVKQMNYTWMPETLEPTDHKPMNGHDWRLMMTMMDVGPTTSCCKRPLETLELFPIKSRCNKS